MGKMTPTYAEQYDHEADDLFDDLAKLENARLSGDFERMRIQRQRMITHLTRYGRDRAFSSNTRR